MLYRIKRIVVVAASTLAAGVGLNAAAPAAHAACVNYDPQTYVCVDFDVTQTDPNPTTLGREVTVAVSTSWSVAGRDGTYCLRRTGLHAELFFDIQVIANGAGPCY